MQAKGAMVRSVCTLMLLSTAAMLGAAPPADGSPFKASRPDACMVTRLALPINERDKARYAEYASLSAGQVAYFDHAFAQYQKAVNALFTEELPRLDALNAEACAVLLRDQKEGMTRARVKSMFDFLDKQDAIAQRLESLENALFSELELILADPQATGTRRARMHRQRMRCTTLHERTLRSSQVDLSHLVENLPMSADLRAQMDVELQLYEDAFTPLTIALEAECRIQERRTLELLTWRERDENDVRLLEAEHVARSYASIDKQAAILRKGFDLQLRIAALNTQTMSRWTDLLETAASRSLTDEYKRRVYPTIHPDYSNVAPAICASVENAGLEKSVLEGLGAACAEHQEKYRAATASMERRGEQWQEFLAKTGFTMNQYDPYREDMRKLRSHRWENTLRLLDVIDSLVPPGSNAQLNKTVSAARRTIEIAVREGSDPRDRFPGP